MTIIERLRDKANSLPQVPGVYIMKDKDGNIIYVGKSKRLKNRVTTYFTGTHSSLKTARMVSNVYDFDYIVCDTEIESLALENTLIKKHSPKYNIKLKDAKSYPFIKVTKEEYPRLVITRDRKGDGGRYFGPYQSGQSARATLEAVIRIFGIPTCKRTFPRDIGKERPCIYRDMARCVAPCAGDITREEYQALIKQAEWVLDGNTRAVIRELTESMNEAAQDMRFERAASLRDSIRALEGLSERQKVVKDASIMRDVFAIDTSEALGVMALLSIRGGALVNKNEFILSSSELADGEDAIALIANYYDTAGSIPREVMLDFPLTDEDRELLSEYLTLIAPYKVSVRIPERGEGRRLCDMALENAREAARQYRLEGEREDKNVKRLTTLLGLRETPRRIEAYDISNWGDENIVASMVVWEGGKLKKSDYRTFIIKSTEGRDDYASMREALSRRLMHIGDGTRSLGAAPDLILLDGGVGHVTTVCEVLRMLELDIPLFGMVKDDYHKTRAITDGDTEISIAHEMGVYGFIYNLQEEAHRFALKASTGAKKKTLTRSSLEKIDGIGPKKAKILLKNMPLAEIRRADVETLTGVKGISRRDAETIYAYYHKSE